MTIQAVYGLFPLTVGYNLSYDIKKIKNKEVALQMKKLENVAHVLKIIYYLLRILALLG